MAIHEGLCPNCGSLMRVNDENETTYCIFCWAAADSEEAIALMENSEGHTFPNTSYPEPSPEEKMKALAAQGLGGVNVMQQPSRKPKQEKRRQGKLTPREKVSLQNKPLVKPYCSKKHRIAILSGILVFLLVIAAIALPVYFTRAGKKAELMEQLPSLIDFASDETRVNIQRQSNQLVTLVNPEETSEAEAEDVFNKYAKVYSEVYGIDIEKAKQKIELNILDEQSGGFRVSYREGEAVVTDLD